MIEDFEFDGLDDAARRTERAKARELRKSRWWQQKTASGRCYYCAKKVAFRDISMDHLVPLARGGRSTKNNLVPACKDCNNRKKSMMPLEWEEYLEKNREV
ncbi:MAG: HNH endonuclease [Desulfobulbaceae bacterium S3730MH12]|nr:MAG: HNH endonuclease [Desulfobulbaceae bacterium S5133MH15]OEU57339.1 MAG: HNH endonuclease [Desulfobulbaceae bacterium S3730MH12]OEU83048.1 MAG: HNH endonuclease [Desulfobulbaceae bacterium C00003063]